MTAGVLGFAVVFGFIAVGALMIYSSITGKGITPPEPNALLQIRLQYKLRGLIGVGFIATGIVVLIAIFKTI